MKILITGSDGFLGKEFTHYFKKEHEIIALNRKQLDVSVESDVKDFFSGSEDVDVILHTAFVGGKRGIEDTLDDLCKNVKSFNNLASHKRNSQLMFCFGSGACYDRSRPIISVSEEERAWRNPKDYYGKAKNIISGEIEKGIYENIFDFRLFGCFGREELPSRFIKSSLRNIREGKPIQIHKDIFMDFFYVGDLCKIIEYYIFSDTASLPSCLNMSYGKAYSLSYIAKGIAGGDHPIELLSEDKDSYTGNGGKLYKLPISLIGLFDGIKHANYDE